MALGVCGALVLSGSSWFFISTGWLTYTDSWIVFAFLAIVYARSPWSLLIVGALAPWIDERFVIGLPLAIFVRTVRPADEPVFATRNHMEWIACLPGVIIYVGIRLWALATRDHTSASFLTANLDATHAIGVPAARYALGLWDGIRAGWIFVGWALIEAFRRSGKWARLILVAITLPALVFTLVIAADLSRAPIILLVWFLPGIEYAWRSRPKAAKLLLCLAAAVNFLTPADQVVSNFSIRIEPLWTELRNLRHPDPAVNAPILTQRAKTLTHRATGELFAKSDWAGALELLNAALADDPGLLDAQLGRAFALEQLSRPLDALHECQVMLNSHPDSPNAWILAGQVSLHLKRYQQARNCWTRALTLLPADNPMRNSLGQSLQNLPRDAAGSTSNITPSK